MSEPAISLDDAGYQNLRAVADRLLETTRVEYVDEGVSGTKDKRPSLDAMMNDAKKKRFDVVLVWRFDRFARSTKHMVTALEEFKHLGIDFISYMENIDTSSPMGKAVFTIISAMAELETNILKERVRAGLANAKAKGRVLGRPSAKVNGEAILQLRNGGLSIRQIGSRMGLDKMTVYKTLKNHAQISSNPPLKTGRGLRELTV